MLSSFFYPFRLLGAAGQQIAGMAWINFLILIMLQIVLGCALVLYGRWIWLTIAPPETSSLIAPFAIIGKSESDAKTALPNAVIGRLSTLRTKIESSINTLRSAERPNAMTTATVQAFGFGPSITLPEDLWSPPNIALKIGEVEFGGILSWLLRSLPDQQLLQVTVLYEKDQSGKDKAFVTGYFRQGRGFAFNFDTDPSSHEIVEQLAYVLVQQAASIQVPNISMLQPDEFRQLVAALDELAALKRNSGAEYTRASDTQVNPYPAAAK